MKLINRIKYKKWYAFILFHWETYDCDNALFIAQVAGKKYFLESLPEEQQASEAIARLLRYKFADTDKEEEEEE